MAEITIYPDAASLTQAAASQFVIIAQQAVATRGRFAVALAGGSTPRLLYRLLTTFEYVERIDWTRTYIFWGDERCVPPDHADSNYRMACETLINRVPIVAGNVYRMRGEAEPTEAAAEYERILRAFFSRQAGFHETTATPPAADFDLVLLGMGDDGHTASLFPGTAAVREQTRWVAGHYVEKLGAWRITLTPAAINAAHTVLFLVTGTGKAGRLRQVLEGPYQPDLLPAQIVRPVHGRLVWMVDAAAASQLANR